MTDERSFTPHHFYARWRLGAMFLLRGFARKSGAGFTLIEIVVVVGIVMVLSGMTLAYTRTNERQIALFTDQAKVVGALGRAKALTLQRYKQDPDASTCGYGAYFEAPDSGVHAVSIFADNDCDNNYNSSADEVFGSALPLDPRIMFTALPDEGVIVFRAPYLEVAPADGAVFILGVRGGSDFVGIEVTSGGAISTLAL
jgi:Tfp pilus assembly major pilin PilA